jgi:hypothetical protein
MTVYMTAISGNLMKDVYIAKSFYQIQNTVSSTECSILNALLPTTFDNSLEMAERQVRP